MRVLVLTVERTNPVEFDWSPATLARDAAREAADAAGIDAQSLVRLQDAEEQQPFPDGASLAQCDVTDGDVLELMIPLCGVRTIQNPEGEHHGEDDF